jgi:prophage antirepressor-like protein
MSESIGAPAPVIFNFQSNEVRTVTRDGEPWFVAADVCAVLDLKNVTMALRHLDDDENTLSIIEGIHSAAGNPEVNIISESGLYALILRSRKPEAKKFRKWVTSEVLPSIRKTGGYGVADAERTKSAFTLALEVAKASAHAVLEAAMNPEAERTDQFMVSHAYDHAKNSYSGAIAWPVERDEFITSVAKLPSAINAEGGFGFGNQDLADIAAACIQQLNARAEHAKRLRAELRSKSETQSS